MIQKKSSAPTVYIVEDDNILRETIKTMIESLRETVITFSNGSEFLDFLNKQPNNSKLFGCIILDVRLPGLSGMEIQLKLREKSEKIPVIFISGHADVPMAVQAMERGAAGFLEKPFREQELLEKVSFALDLAKKLAADQAKYLEFETCLNSLTKRERVIFELAMEGTLNKIIADKLGISERTVEVHRSNLLKKFNSRHLPEIIKTYLDYKSTLGL